MLPLPPRAGWRARARWCWADPHRPLDDTYRGFLGLAAGAWASASPIAAPTRREFRALLTLLLGPIEDLRSDPGSGDRGSGEALDIVDRNAHRLGTVGGLAAGLHAAAGRADARRHRPVDLATLTVDLTSAFRSAVIAAGLTYSVDCPDLGEPVHVDPDMRRRWCSPSSAPH